MSRPRKGGRGRRGARVAFLLPGFGEQFSYPGYVAATAALERAGWRVVRHSPRWGRRTIENWLADFLAFYRREASSAAQVAGVGFSFGALILYLASAEVPFDRLWLCSVSPYFSEDLPKLPALAGRILGVRRMRAFTKIRPPRAPKVGKAAVLAGETELPLCVARSRKAARHLSATLSLVADTDHCLHLPSYAAALQKAIAKLSSAGQA